MLHRRWRSTVPAFAMALALQAVPLAAEQPAGEAMPSANTHAISITTVFDNYAVDPRLATRWGFAAVIATPSATVLFDTGGDGATLLANMKALRLDPAGIEMIVLSHSHGDHVGGLHGFLRTNRNVLVYLLPSFPRRLAAMIVAVGARHRTLRAPTEVATGIHATGPLGTATEEQALVVETGDGLVVLTGCAHPGIVPIVQRAREMMPKAEIALVMGGFHLLSASHGEIDAIVRAFRALGVRRVAPSHCTGDLARSRFREAYGADYVEGGVGMAISLPPPAGRAR